MKIVLLNLLIAVYFFWQLEETAALRRGGGGGYRGGGYRSGSSYRSSSSYRSGSSYRSSTNIRVRTGTQYTYRVPGYRSSVRVRASYPTYHYRTWSYSEKVHYMNTYVIYASPSYRARYIRSNQNLRTNAEVCYNDEDKLFPNSTEIKWFVCPYEDDDWTREYCCGNDERQDCCTYDEYKEQYDTGASMSPTNIALAAIFGLTISLIIIFASKYLCPNKHKTTISVVQSPGLELPLIQPSSKPTPVNDETNIPICNPPTYETACNDTTNPEIHINSGYPEISNIDTYLGVIPNEIVEIPEYPTAPDHNVRLPAGIYSETQNSRGYPAASSGSDLHSYYPPPSV